MTRIEKFAQYRQEIADESQLQFSIMSNAQKVNNYKLAINNINKNILSSETEYKFNLETMIQKNNFLQSVPKEIVDAVGLINSFSISMISNEFGNFFDQIKNSSILAPGTNEIKEAWLYKNNNDFKLFVSAINVSGIKSTSKFNAEKLLKENYDKSSNPINSNVETITLIPIKNKRKVTFYIYIISAFAIIILVLIMAGVIMAGLINNI